MAGGEETMLQRVCDALRELERQTGVSRSASAHDNGEVGR